MPCNRIHVEGFLLRERERKKREGEGDRSDRREERGREKKRKEGETETEKKREGWEVGRVLLKRNSELLRMFSKWLERRT